MSSCECCTIIYTMIRLLILMFSSENRGLLLKLVEVELIFLLFYVTETEIYVLYSYILICKE